MSDGICNMQEPWILHDFSEDFYGEELRLIVVGYIRPEVELSLNMVVPSFSLPNSNLC